MSSWLVVLFEDGQEQIVANYPDGPAPTRGADRRDAPTRARERLIELASSEFSAGLHARVDQAHLEAASPHTVFAEATRTEATVMVHCSLGCPERRLRFFLEHR